MRENVKPFGVVAWNRDKWFEKEQDKLVQIGKVAGTVEPLTGYISIRAVDGLCEG